jgi:hypothetical protein
MSQASLVIRCRLRKFILSRCHHWSIPRQRIPAAVIDQIIEDLTKQVDVRVCSMLTKADPLPKQPAPPRPHKAKVYKRSLKGQPSLL